MPPEVRAFRIGGYQVGAQRTMPLLADRKGRALRFEEILNYQRIVTALAKTIELQAAIDEVCAEMCGW